MKKKKLNKILWVLSIVSCAKKKNESQNEIGKQNKTRKQSKDELFGETGRQRLKGEFNSRNGFNQSNRK